MNKDIHKILMYCLGGLALVILGAIHVWAPVCDGFLELGDGRYVPMRCLYTAKAASVLAILVLIQAITSIVTKKNNPVMLIALGIMMISLTYESVIGIGICKKVMACHDTAFWVRGGAFLTIVIAIVPIFLKPTKTSE